MTNAPRELAAWGDVRVEREIAKANRASRTWLVSVNGVRAVAKLTFDQRFAVEPGFEIARFVQLKTGVQCGMPLATVDNRITVPVSQRDGPPWTLAVITFVDGRSALVEEFAGEAGRLLGTAHAVLAGNDVPAVPGQLLSWFRDFYKDETVNSLVDEIERHELTSGVVYGDPFPELIRTPDATLALIDWGTPSAGPFMHDLAIWERHAGTSAPLLREAYFSAAPSALSECDALPLFDALWERVQRF